MITSKSMITWNKALPTCITAKSKARGGFETRPYYFISEERESNGHSEHQRPHSLQQTAS
jgi:hypothetical protein